MNSEYIKNPTGCKCGKSHLSEIKNIVTGKGVIKRLPEELQGLGVKKAFILSDINEYNAAGEKVAEILQAAGMEYSKYIFNEKQLEPDEYAVGSAVMHFDQSCDAVVADG